MLSYYAATYQPGSPVEEVLAHEMVAARWRMQRLRVIETVVQPVTFQTEPRASASGQPLVGIT
jgi:hypothetical protein